jgi:hypothetical protein
MPSSKPKSKSITTVKLKLPLVTDMANKAKPPKKKAKSAY